MRGNDGPSERLREEARRYNDGLSSKGSLMALKAAELRLTLLRMEAREGVRAQGYEPRVSVGGERDRMAQTDARMDYEARMRERIAAALRWEGPLEELFAPKE